MGKQCKQERLYFLGLQNHCRWWLQPWYEEMLATWEKSYKRLDSILKSRDIILPTTVHLVKSMVSPVVMYGCESWTIRKAECRKTDAFELWWMASPTQWTWVWASSERWWRTGKSGVVKDREDCVQQSMGSEIVVHDWTTEQQRQQNY